MKRIKGYGLYCLLMIGLVILPAVVVAETVGLGELAAEVTAGPMESLKQVMYGISYITGMFFLFKAYENFKGHRFRPETVGIANVLFMACFGLTLILLPMVHYLVNNL